MNIIIFCRPSWYQDYFGLYNNDRDNFLLRNIKRMAHKEPGEFPLSILGHDRNKKDIQNYVLHINTSGFNQNAQNVITQLKSSMDSNSHINISIVGHGNINSKTFSSDVGGEIGISEISSKVKGLYNDLIEAFPDSNNTYNIDLLSCYSGLGHYSSMISQFHNGLSDSNYTGTICSPLGAVICNEVDNVIGISLIQGSEEDGYSTEWNIENGQVTKRFLTNQVNKRKVYGFHNSQDYDVFQLRLLKLNINPVDEVKEGADDLPLIIQSLAKRAPYAILYSMYDQSFHRYEIAEINNN